MDNTLVDYNNRLLKFMNQLKNEIHNHSFSYHGRLETFFKELSFRVHLFNQFKAGTDKIISSDFNVFDFIAPDENKLSDILAEIFNMYGSHGQGDLFLKLFIQFLKKNDLTVDDVEYRVMREVSANGRIDIFLESSSFAIIIENKPFTYDQKDQINRYYDSIVHKHGENVVVIYLNKTNMLPQNFSDEKKRKQIEELINKNRLLVLPYIQLIEYLSECRKNCESDKFRFFLKDFIEYIQKTFFEIKEDNNG